MTLILVDIDIQPSYLNFVLAGSANFLKFVVAGSAILLYFGITFLLFRLGNNIGRMKNAQRY